MMTSTSTNMTATLQPQQPDLKMMKLPPPPAEMFEQRRRSNSASPSDKILKRSYHHSSTSGGCPSPLALRPKTYQVIPVVVLALPVNKLCLLILWFLWPNLRWPLRRTQTTMRWPRPNEETLILVHRFRELAAAVAKYILQSMSKWEVFVQTIEYMMKVDT